MRNKNRKVVTYSLLVVIGMFAFSFALVPLYNAYCKVTGINTSLTLSEFEKTPDLTHEITIQFIATNNAALPWEFKPLKNSLTLHPGENSRVLFYVKNNSNHTMTVQAIPSYAPVTAPNYFHKIECFCFRQQTLKAGEEREMPVVFHLSKIMPADIHTITLAYTLFDMTSKRNSA
jgi:cytochrome c oxidase assembly protein subunit 11